MPNATVIPFMPRLVQNHPVVAGFASAAAGFIRQMAIKPYKPGVWTRELKLCGAIGNFHGVRNHIFKEKGSGHLPTIVVGGFVPDATEAVEFQRELFREYGSIYYINYARHGFSAEMFQAQLSDLVEDLNRRGKPPVIFAISFGCGLVAEFLRGAENDRKLKIKGAIMVSPVLCTSDLVRTEREKGTGVRMLESNLRRILKADGDDSADVYKQIERARRCFQGLFETGAENRTLNRRHLSIRKKIMDVIGATPAIGGYQRVLAMKRFGIPNCGNPITKEKVLTLLAESEDDILVSTSPTLAALRDCYSRNILFPNGSVKTVVSSAANDSVPHASLIFHSHCYNPHIKGWYDRLSQPILFAVV